MAHVGDGGEGSFGSIVMVQRELRHCSKGAQPLPWDEAIGIPAILLLVQRRVVGDFVRDEGPPPRAAVLEEMFWGNQCVGVPRKSRHHRHVQCGEGEGGVHTHHQSKISQRQRGAVVDSSGTHDARNNEGAPI